jgi:ABC-type oligopeptide transport system substrate-binding subunit
MRRLLSILAFVLGTALLVVSVAPAGSGASPKVLRLNMSDSDINYMDPALNYDFYGWTLGFTTCVKLLNYPDKTGTAGSRIAPEGATGMPRLSPNGRTYTFTVRKGFRFSDGSAVTARSYARAIERVVHPKMASPGAQFFMDIAGARAFVDGKAKTISGIKVSGDQIAVTLTQARPDFLSRMAMNFTCVVPENLPIQAKGVNVLPGAGPYYVAAKTPGRSIILKQNPYYSGTRPQRVDEIHVTVNVDSNQSYLQVKRGDADYDLAGLPPTAHAELTKEFGINRGRYFVHEASTIQYIALNTERPLFKDVPARQAVANAVDRRALLRLWGLNGGAASEQLLPPTIPGYRDADIYPLDKPDVAKALELLRGKTAKAVLYTGNDPVSRNSVQVIQANMKRIGITVEPKVFTFAVLIEKAGTRGEPFDMFLIGWFADYPDPYDFVNVLLHGRSISKTNNINTAYWNDPAYNRKMDAAARLSGDARYRTYGNLDIDITRNASPFVVFGNLTTREFVSSRVGCYSYQSAWGAMNLTLTCLK